MTSAVDWALKTNYLSFYVPANTSPDTTWWFTTDDMQVLLSITCSNTSPGTTTWWFTTDDMQVLLSITCFKTWPWEATLRHQSSSLPCLPRRWNPQGTGKRGRPQHHTEKVNGGRGTEQRLYWYRLYLGTPGNHRRPESRGKRRGLEGDLCSIRSDREQCLLSLKALSAIGTLSSFGE